MINLTQAQSQYDINQQLLGQLMQGSRRATPASALAQALGMYFTNKNMRGATDKMQSHKLAEEQKLADQNQGLMSAWQGYTPRENAQSGGRMVPQNDRQGLMSAMMGSPDTGLRNLALGQAIQTPKNTTDKKIQQYQQAQKLGLIEPGMSYSDFAKITVPTTTNTITLAGELPDGWQYKDPTNPRLGAEPIPEGPADTAYLAQKKAEELRVTQEAKDREKAKSNKEAYETYKVTTENVMRSIQQTSTGYFAGRVPTIEASAQVAEHANNVLFPAIKKLVREGESGVFTDQDAQDVRKLLPTRETHPDALPMVMWQLDSWVASKMGQPQPPLPNQKIIENPSEDQYKSLKIGDPYMWDGVKHFKGQ